MLSICCEDVCIGWNLILTFRFWTECCGVASTEVRQVYKQFIGAVVELIDGEMPSEEFGEIALSAYHLFGRPAEEEDNSVNRNIVEKK